MHGNGDSTLKLFSQSQRRDENGVAQSTANGVKRDDVVEKKHIRHLQTSLLLSDGQRISSNGLLKDRGTSTQGLQKEGPDRRTGDIENFEDDDDSASDGEKSPLWTRPAHMRNGGIPRPAADLGVPLNQTGYKQGDALRVLDETQASLGSLVARITLTGDSKLDQSFVRVAGGGLLKVCVSKDCELQHNFEIESCSGGKVVETPIIVPGTVYVW